MEHFEHVILMVSVAGLVVLPDIFEVPYLTFLVTGGRAPGSTPGVPGVDLVSGGFHA